MLYPVEFNRDENLKIFETYFSISQATNKINFSPVSPEHSKKNQTKSLSVSNNDVKPILLCKNSFHVSVS